MKNVERKLYQKNKLGATLIVASILLNVVFTIFVLNQMDVNYDIGLFVLVTILMLLIGFLTSVKVEMYSILWSFIAVGLGAIQFVRYLTAQINVEGNVYMIIQLSILGSALFAILGGLYSYKVSTQRANYIKEHKIADEALQN